MTLRDDLLPVIYGTRGILGDLGFAPISVSVVVRTYSEDDQPWQDGYETETIIPILENGRNPKVRQLTANDYLRGADQDCELEIGPITPQHTVGATTQGTLLETLRGADIANNAYMFLMLNGEEYTDAKFQIQNIKTKPLGYYIQVKKASQ